jgi:hypothetical protein
MKLEKLIEMFNYSNRNFIVLGTLALKKFNPLLMKIWLRNISKHFNRSKKLRGELQQYNTKNA